MLNRLLIPLLLTTTLLPLVGSQESLQPTTRVQPIEPISQLSLRDSIASASNTIASTSVARYSPRSNRGSGRRHILGYGVATPSSFS